MTRESHNRHFASFLAIAAFVLVLSQAIGYWVNATIPLHGSLELNPFLFFTHVRNHGGVFGMLQGQGWIFGVFSLGLLSAVGLYLRFGPALPRYEYLCFGLIVGGGASNVLDRLLYGSVIDFIDIQGIPYWHYVFNTADVMIHLGIWPMLALSLRR
ncbi:MAG: signal peptidase II [Gammaproteobacteria bacterium]|jgi:signal peptidase II|nr:signal peptidase II [Gammaproteobacteria bacterium]